MTAQASIRSPWRQHPQRLLPLGLLLFAVGIGAAACQQGTTYIAGSLLLCSGPSCPSHCTSSSQCPAGYSCLVGQCYTYQSGSGAGAGAGGSGFGLTTGGTTAGSGGSTAGTVQSCTINACGDCLPNCVTDAYGVVQNVVANPNGQTTSQGATVGLLPPPDPTSQVYQAANGTITLVNTGTPVLANEFAWPANSIEGTVSQVDTRSGVEVGRYPSVLRIPDANGVPQPQVPDYWTQCNQPSRTAVDPNRNLAFVANRNDADDGWIGGPCRSAYCTNYAGQGSGCGPAGQPYNPTALNWDQGSVTKFGRYDDALCNALRNPGLSGCACPDRNGDGKITTSRDVNGDGTIYIGTCAGACTAACRADNDCLDPNSKYCYLGTTNATVNSTGKCSSKPQEFYGYADECVMWTLVLPRVGGSTPPNSSNPSAPPSQWGPKMRGMALDRSGALWVGDYRAALMYKVNTASTAPFGGVLSDPDGAGPLTGTYAQSSGVVLQAYPYGAVIDANGIISVINPDGNLDQVDTTSGLRYTAGGARTQAINAMGGYGISTDANRRVWVPGWGAGGGSGVHDNAPRGPLTPQVTRYDPATQTWSVFPCGTAAAPTNNPGCSSDPGYGPYDSFNYSGGSTSCPYTPDWNYNNNTCFGWRGRGATTDVLDNGSSIIWAVYNSGYGYVPGRPQGWLVGFDAATGAVITRARTDIDAQGVPLACSGPIGVGIGANHVVYIVSNASNTLCGYNPATGAWNVVSIGQGPYTYSDFTGNLYRTFTQNSGTYTLTFQGCSSGSYQVQSWQNVTIQAVAPGTAPAPNSSQISVRVQTAASPSAFNNSNWVTLTPTFDYTQASPLVYPLHLTQQQNTLPFMQIQFNLTAGTNGSTIYLPQLKGVNVARKCVLVGGG
jgi:hypothetical protein